MEVIVIARCFSLAPILSLLVLASGARAQVRSDPAPTVTAPARPDGVTPANPAPPSAAPQADEAARQLRQQERQRILGLIPNFNTTNLPNAAPLSREQKFQLALRSAVDPVQILGAAILAGTSQARHDFPEYGQGSLGYLKRFGAGYADSFDGTMLGNAAFPALLHQDPRYFRKGTGSITARLLYAVSTTVRARNDNGKWAPNYSNILGNITAGGIANLYYPAADRSVSLTVERAFTVTAEGTLGAVLSEFWPDISRKLFHKH
jgi:hypothetical protein